jgi:hypothetical protein
MSGTNAFVRENLLKLIMDGFFGLAWDFQSRVT